MNENKKILIFVLVSFCLGFLMGITNNSHQIEDKNNQNQLANQKIETKTETKIVYVPKETIKYIDQATGNEIVLQEKTDVEANIGKQTINVKINGKEVEFEKSDDERFVFDKNKIVLDQVSKMAIDINVQPVKIDKTKHWGIGAGYGSKKIGGILTFPIDKKINLDGWVYYNNEEKKGGIMIRF
ncbi:MAG: hypothetical protein MJ170_02710 [Alphaproteobacteria bacterium]|nr:hypothetical protein [Alphaproteobacteria bacterium]